MMYTRLLSGINVHHWLNNNLHLPMQSLNQGYQAKIVVRRIV